MDVNRLRLAVDTNVLLDWAEDVEDILDALNTIDARFPVADKLIPPATLQELAFLHLASPDLETRDRAARAFRKIHSENVFRPILELPFHSELTEELATLFRTHSLLPCEEINDSKILAQTILLDCDILLTSDEHLRGIDHQELTWLLNAQDLAVPVIATPREIVRKFFH